MTTTQTPIRIDRRKTENRVAKWVGLLALAGLLAIATLPLHNGHRTHGDEIGTAQIEAGGQPWHG